MQVKVYLEVTDREHGAWHVADRYGDWHWIGGIASDVYSELLKKLYRVGFTRTHEGIVNPPSKAHPDHLVISFVQ